MRRRSSPAPRTRPRNAREVADGGGLTLRVGAIDAASASFLPRRDHALCGVLPNVDLRLTETMTAQQLQMLRTGRLDLALIRPPMTASEFPFEVLRQERLVALLPEAHPLAALESLSITDLAGEPIIIPAKRARPYAYDLVMAYFASAGLVPRILQETTEKPAMLAMVAPRHRRGAGAGLDGNAVPSRRALPSDPGCDAGAEARRRHHRHGLARPTAPCRAGRLIDALRRSAGAFDPSIV